MAGHPGGRDTFFDTYSQSVGKETFSFRDRRTATTFHVDICNAQTYMLPCPRCHLVFCADCQMEKQYGPDCICGNPEFKSCVGILGQVNPRFQVPFEILDGSHDTRSAFMSTRNADKAQAHFMSPRPRRWRHARQDSMSRR